MGCVSIVYVGGATPAEQIVDTDLNQHIRREYTDEEATAHRCHRQRDDSLTWVVWRGRENYASNNTKLRAIDQFFRCSYLIKLDKDHR